MKPIDAIEGAVRLHNGILPATRIYDIVKGLVNEDVVDAAHLIATVQAAPDRFLVEGADMIRLQPERMADRLSFFREQTAEVRKALRRSPHAYPMLGLELALIYASARWTKEQLPIIEDKGNDLWSILEDLAQEFPALERELKIGLEDAWLPVRYRVESALLLMSSTRLTPLEYVQEMRNVVAQEARNGQFCLPWSVASLMARLLGDDVKEVFDPAADGSVVPLVLALNGSAHADAVFVNSFANFFTTLQARMLGAEMRAHQNDKPWPDQAKRYQHCISAPPFGGRVREDGSLRAVEVYEVAINKIIKHLAPGGRAVVLVPESMLFTTTRMQLRKSLLDQGVLRAVISLPVGTFLPYAGIKTSILVFDRSVAPNSPVRFVDAGHYTRVGSKRERNLEVEEIIDAYEASNPVRGALDVKLSDLRADEAVSWSLSRFISQLQFESIVAESPSIEVAELGSVLHDDILALGTLEGLPLFKVSDLSTDVLDLVRTASDGQRDATEPRKGARRLDVPALLLARVGGKLNPTLFDPVSGPIAAGSNVFTFRVDTRRAIPEYLAFELRSPLVQDQLDAYHQGSTISSIAKADLLRLKVRLPELSEQQRIVRERKESILLAKREEIARQEKQHGLSTDEWRILGAVEHSFRPVLALVEQPMEAIRQITRELDAEKQLAVSEELSKVNAGLDRMRGLFKLINDVIRSDKGSIRRVPVDLRRLFRTECRGLAQELKKLRVYFQYEAGLETPDGVIAMVDPRQFALVIQNLLTNMAKHACRPEMEELHVLVHVGTRQEPGRTWLVITMENDGRPFPVGFTHQDLITFGKRLDATNGNGIGGYLMDRIIANHNGRFTSCNLVMDERTARSGFSEEQRLDEYRGKRMNWELGSTHMTVRFTIELPVDNTAQYD